MNEQDVSYENYIFFLQFSEKLPEYYYHLARFFSEWNISLIPITPQSLSELKTPAGQFIIAVVPDLQTYRTFSSLRRKFLDFSLMSKKYRLVEVSSFKQTSSSKKLEIMKVYHHFSLPIKVDALGNQLSIMLYTEKKEHDRWPGGRRAKLPPGVTISSSK